MNNPVQKKSLTALIVTIALISLLPIIAIGLYNHPSADDFGYSIQVHDAVLNGASVPEILKTAFDTSLSFMNTWQGLYSAAFLLALQPAVFGEQYYAVTTVIMIAIMGIGICLFINSIIKNLLGLKSKWGYFISLILLTYLVQTLPSPVEGLYWYNGAVNYLFFWGLLLCNCAILIKYWSNDCLISPGLILSALLCFIISGGNHITAFICILVNILFVVFAIIQKKKYLVILPTISGMIGFIINVTSPGTAIRRAADGCDSSVIKTIIRCGYKAISCNSNFATFSLLILLLLLTPIIIKLMNNIKNQSIYKKPILLGLLLFDYATISAMYCVPYYAMGVFGEGRVTDTIYCTYTLLAVLTYAYIVGYVRSTELGQQIKNFEGKVLENKLYRFILHAGLVFSILYIVLVGNGVGDYSNGMQAAQEILSGEASCYNREYYDRIELYNNPELIDVTVKPFSQRPKLLFFNDMNTDGTLWPNTKIAKYYHKNTISLESEYKKGNY